MTGPILETERLILRPTELGDFEGWAKFMGDAEASKFIGGPQAPSIAWRGFLQVAGAWKIQGFSMFSVVEKATGQWIGPGYRHSFALYQFGRLQLDRASSTSKSFRRATSVSV